MLYAEKGGSRSDSTSVGTTSTQVLPFNAHRKQVVIINDSDTIIYLSKGFPAALNTGIRLNPAGGSMVIEPDYYGRIWKGAINAISSVGAKVLSWTEDW